ncbi:hypothetical protein CTAYLR_008806 [Chrysophaeum taylorii]|uniref:EF-hand domain-containing protein n=1 Tax=Chrysophaeum taylorii TaxID=2483200 RepID=A0AAD7UCL4_9STRA|nr:hypothetical protein CTAYLR_008806 [Chrysophaeum taylorii]
MRFLLLVAVACALSPPLSKQVAPLGTRRGVLAGIATALTSSAALALSPEDEFRVADLDRNGRLSKSEFTTWYKGNDLLSDQGLGISFPEIAFDVTGLVGFIVGVYATSYAYYISQQATAEKETAEKQLARAKKQQAAS